MDALYLRLRPSRFHVQTGVFVWGKGEMFGTRLTIQGSQGYNSSAVQTLEGGKAYFQGP